MAFKVPVVIPLATKEIKKGEKSVRISLISLGCCFELGLNYEGKTVVRGTTRESAMDLHVEIVRSVQSHRGNVALVAERYGFIS